jgi:hypothetical protein
MPDALPLATPDTFRLTADEIAQLEGIRLLRQLPTVRAALTYAIATEFRTAINQGVSHTSRPHARNGKPSGHHL